MRANDPAPLHPADALASVRAEIKTLEKRESELKAGLIADREARVGTGWHAVVDRRVRETTDWRRVLEDMRVVYSSAAAPGPAVGESIRAWADEHANRMRVWDDALADAIGKRTSAKEFEQVSVERLPDLAEVLRLLTGPCAYVDVETTGFSPAAGDRVVSLGVAFTDGMSDRTWIFDPQGRRSSPQALAVHGLSDSHLALASPFSTYAATITAVIEDRALVAHNAPFDMGFLQSEFARTDLGFPSIRGVVDTRVLSKLIWPGEPAGLDAVCERIGLAARGPQHEALNDARRVAAVARAMVPLLHARLDGLDPDEFVVATEAGVVTGVEARA